MTVSGEQIANWLGKARIKDEPFRVWAVAVVALGCLLFNIFATGQSLPSPQSSEVKPESGFLSPSKYTSAFFGFSFRIPEGADLHEVTLSLRRSTQEHFLIGFRSPEKGLIAFTVTAKQIEGDPANEARKAAGGEEMLKTRKIEVGGKIFWRCEPSKGTGSMQTVIFATGINGYVLRFEIDSFNARLTNELEQSIEGLAFFDPTKAKEIAGADAKPYMPGASQFPISRMAQLTTGSVSTNLYRNPQLGIQYQFPEGWVLMSKASQVESANGRSHFEWGNSPTVQQEHDSASECTRNLLYVRRYLEPPATVKVNPIVVLLAADPDCTPETTFPKSIDDREAIQQIAKQVVRYFKTSTASPSDAARVRAFRNADRIMIEVSQAFTTKGREQSDEIMVFSSILVMQINDYWVIWMFASGDQKELEDLRKTRIFFDVPDPGSARSQ